jgi:prepilin-type N-terminal cleavage/methylation domain-containing protein
MSYWKPMMKLKFSSRGMTLIEVVIAVAIVAILSAIAIPAYGGYATRSRVSECINLIAPAKLAVSMRSTTFSFSPTDYCASIVVHPDGVIVATTTDTGADVDPVIQFTPTFAGSVSWHCGVVSGNYADVPPICRNKPTAATGGNLSSPPAGAGTASGGAGSAGGSQGGAAGGGSSGNTGGSGAATGGSANGGGSAGNPPPAAGGNAGGSTGGTPPAGGSGGPSGNGSGGAGNGSGGSTGGGSSNGGGGSGGSGGSSGGGGGGGHGAPPVPKPDPKCKPKKGKHGGGHGHDNKPGSCKKKKH